MVRPARLERATFWFVARRSIQLSYGRLFSMTYAKARAFGASGCGSWICSILSTAHETKPNTRWNDLQQLLFLRDFLRCGACYSADWQSPCQSSRVVLAVLQVSGCCYHEDVTAPPHCL